MRNILWTADAPAYLPEGPTKAGESATVPDGRAAELINLGWAKSDGPEPEPFVAGPMYASSQPSKEGKKAGKADKTPDPAAP